MTHASTLPTVIRSQVGRCRMRRIGCIARLAVGTAPLIACGGGADERGAQQLALSRSEQPILRGELDDTHPQVVLLADSSGFLCTGTLIDVDGAKGYLLTAAHCVTEEEEDGSLAPVAADRLLVVPGADFAKSRTAFSVDAVSVEPRYTGSFATDDVAVVRFVFGSAPAPAAIPALAASEDDLAVDAELLLVGYGQTDADDENTQRRRVARRVEDLDAERVVYTQEDGKGACFGDSGGPGLVEVGGAERVAVVISGGVDSDERCAGGFGVAMRVSAYEDFIAAALTASSRLPASQDVEMLANDGGGQRP